MPVITFRVSHITFFMLSPFSQSKSFLKTGIANPLDGSGYDKIWDDSSDETSDKVKILPPSWDADEDFYFVNHYEEQQLQRMYLN